ncbi:MAG: macro domain-containing protein [Oscillospiraceae bacterium]|nr:macro domain-containing protein [Oscillospiraceae bacterium]
MIYHEMIQDLFSVPDSYYFAQCISADFAMGKGIALQFNQHFQIKKRLKANHPDYLHFWKLNHLTADCILENKVFNLITKPYWRSKPTYQTLELSLQIMKKICLEKEISKLAMPLIACGLDGLDWNQVSFMIQNIFFDTEIEILVCKQS